MKYVTKIAPPTNYRNFNYMNTLPFYGSYPSTRRPVVLKDKKGQPQPPPPPPPAIQEKVRLNFETGELEVLQGGKYKIFEHASTGQTFGIGNDAVLLWTEQVTPLNLEVDELAELHSKIKYFYATPRPRDSTVVSAWYKRIEVKQTVEGPTYTVYVQTDKAEALTYFQEYITQNYQTEIGISASSAAPGKLKTIYKPHGDGLRYQLVKHTTYDEISWYKDMTKPNQKWEIATPQVEDYFDNESPATITVDTIKQDPFGTWYYHENINKIFAKSSFTDISDGVSDAWWVFTRTDANSAWEKSRWATPEELQIINILDNIKNEKAKVNNPIERTNEEYVIFKNETDSMMGSTILTTYYVKEKQYGKHSFWMYRGQLTSSYEWVNDEEMYNKAIEANALSNIGTVTKINDVNAGEFKITADNGDIYYATKTPQSINQETTLYYKAWMVRKDGENAYRFITDDIDDGNLVEKADFAALNPLPDDSPPPEGPPGGQSDDDIARQLAEEEERRRKEEEEEEEEKAKAAAANQQEQSNNPINIAYNSARAGGDVEEFATYISNVGATPNPDNLDWGINQEKAAEFQQKNLPDSVMVQIDFQDIDEANKEDKSLIIENVDGKYIPLLLLSTEGYSFVTNKTSESYTAYIYNQQQQFKNYNIYIADKKTPNVPITKKKKFNEPKEYDDILVFDDEDYLKAQ